MERFIKLTTLEVLELAYKSTFSRETKEEWLAIEDELAGRLLSLKVITECDICYLTDFEKANHCPALPF